MPPYFTPWRSFFGTPVVFKMQLFRAQIFWKMKIQEFWVFGPSFWPSIHPPRSDLRTTESELREDDGVRRSESDGRRNGRRADERGLDEQPPRRGGCSSNPSESARRTFLRPEDEHQIQPEVGEERANGGRFGATRTIFMSGAPPPEGGLPVHLPRRVEK